MGDTASQDAQTTAVEQEALAQNTPGLGALRQGALDSSAPGQGASNRSAQHGQEALFPPPPPLLPEHPEAAIFQAMAAYDNLGRHIIMEQRREMTKSQIDAIMSVHLFGSLTMTQISNHLAVSNEQASRVIGPLVERGLMQRMRRPDNQRIVEVSLTDAGREFVFNSWNEVLATLNSRLQILSARERKRLIKASQEAVDVLKQLLQLSR